jgi:hypothetical protein
LCGSVVLKSSSLRKLSAIFAEEILLKAFGNVDELFETRKSIFRNSSLHIKHNLQSYQGTVSSSNWMTAHPFQAPLTDFFGRFLASLHIL